MKKIFFTALILFSSSSFADNNAKNLLKEINRNECATANDDNTMVISCSNGTVKIINGGYTTVCIENNGLDYCRTTKNENNILIPK
ncbi:hypothetical protein ACTOJ1_000931 [Shigella flexneri]